MIRGYVVFLLMLNVTRRRNTSIPGCVLVIQSALLLAPPADTVAAQQIDTLAIRQYTSVLAHDSLLGRGTGSAGAAAAARYIASRCAGLGLAPLGRDYLIPMELMESVLIPETTQLQVQAGGAASARIFAAPSDFFPNLGRLPSHTSITGPAVYVGDADSLDQWRTPAPEPSAIAVTIGLPRYSILDGLDSLGFAAAIHLVPNRPAYNMVAQSRGGSRWAHASTDVPSSLLPAIPSFIAGTEVADALTQDATRHAGRLPVLTTTVRLTVDASVRVRTVHNVACFRPSADNRDAGIIAYSAHFDHLGVSTPDVTGDSIYNGFSDNAAGVAMLLAIAEDARANPPPFPVAFLFFNAEERGLLGSDAFVYDPPVPLGRFAAVINLDAGAPPAPPTTWRLAGADTPLRTVGISTGTSAGWEVTTSGPTPNTDYFPFYRRGVPAIFVVPGPGPYEGMSQQESDALKARWDQYHRAGDHWSAEFPFSGLQRYAEFARAIGRAFGDNY